MAQKLYTNVRVPHERYVVQTAIISLDETCIAKMVQAKTKLT
jgi:hypothetical protein